MPTEAAHLRLPMPAGTLPVEQVLARYPERLRNVGPCTADLDVWNGKRIRIAGVVTDVSDEGRVLYLGASADAGGRRMYCSVSEPQPSSLVGQSVVVEGTYEVRSYRGSRPAGSAGSFLSVANSDGLVAARILP